MYYTIDRPLLLSTGVTDSQLRSALRCCLGPLRAGVYRVQRRCARPEHLAIMSHVPEDWRLPEPALLAPYQAKEVELSTRILAMRTRLGPRQVFSHYSAARLHRLPLSGPVPEYAEVSGPGESRRRRMHRIWQRPRIADADIVEIGGTQATAVPRTIIDVARNHSTATALGMADFALRNALAVPDELSSAIVRSGYARKLRPALLVAAIADGTRESVGESRTALVLHRAGIRGLRSQYEIHDEHGRFVARVDFADPDRKIVVEFDGFAKYGMHEHLTERDVLEREKARQERLMGLGWTMIRLTWADLDSPARYLAKLAPLLS